MKKLVVILALFVGVQTLNAAVSFTVNKTAGCPVLGVTFVDNSVHPFPVLNRTWDYGDGSRFLVSDSSGHTYVTSGLYSPKLIVCYTNGTCDSFQATNLINVYAKPTINYGVTDSLGCAPHTVNFTNNIIPGCGTVSRLIVIYDVANNLFKDSAANAATGGNFTHTYPTAGSRDVYIYARNTCGCFKDTTMTAKIKTYIKPTANFTGAPLISCDTVITTSFTNTSSTSSANFTTNWTFGNNLGNSINNNPSFTFSKYMGLTHNVKLVLSERYNNNLLTCSDSITRPNYVTVRDPKKGFTESGSVFCVGQSVSLTDTSNPGVSTSWRVFGPATLNATGANTSVNFTTAGTYSVEMIVSYPGGCNDTVLKTNIITVNPKPTADFKTTDTLFCAAPKNATFSNLSTGATTNNWTFTNGTPNTSAAITPPAISFSANGTIKLVVSNAFGCKDSLTKTNYVKFLGVDANFSVNKTGGCTNDTFKFTNTSVGLVSDTIVSYKWDFDNDKTIDLTTTSKTNPNWVYGVDSCRRATLIIETQSGCTDTNRVNICTGPLPTASYTVNKNKPCIKEPVTFTYTGSLPITRTTWYPRAPSSYAGVPLDTPFAGTFSYAYTDTGRFTPIVVAENNGCKDTSLLPTEVDTILILGPKAQFNYNTRCNISKTTVKFNNTSIRYQKSYWDFGVLTASNDTSTLDSPQYTFPDSGCYFVRLIVENTTNGCVDTFIQSVCVYKPVLDFASNSPISCVGVVMTFTNTSTTVSSNPANTKWNLFGTHTYSPISYAGGILEGSPLNYSYPANGKYSVCMKNIDPNGCPDSICKTDYIIITNPVVKIGMNDTLFCPGQTVVLTDSSKGLGRGLESYRWDTNTVVVGFTKNTSITYNYPGRHQISHLIVDSSGCSATLDTFVTYVLPVASIGKNRDSICVGQTIDFDNYDITPGYTYTWSFQNATPSTYVGDVPPSITFNALGKQVVRMIASAWYSTCPDTTYDTVTVYKPTAAFTQDFSFANCGPLFVQFTGTPIGTNINKHFWNFDDIWTPPFGTNQLTSTPFHKFDKPGNYNVMYIVETTTGCRDSLIKPNSPEIAGPQLFPQFKYLDSCKQARLEFVFESRYAKKIDIYPQGAGLVSIIHSDTNCGQGTKPNCFDTFKITYVNPGTYYIDVFVTDSGNLCNIPYKFGPYKVLSPPTARIWASDSVICKNNNIQFNDTSTYVNGRLQSIWTLDNIPTLSGLKSPVNFYPTPGNYTVKLFVEDSSHCVDSTTRLMVVNDLPKANFNPTDVCLGNVSAFTNASTLNGTATSFTSFWNFGDTASTSDTSLLNNPNYTYPKSASYNVYLKVTDNNGCTDTIVKPAVVYTPPKADFDSSGFCANVPTVFTNKSTIGSNAFGNPYSLWDFDLGFGPTSTVASPQNTYTTPGNKNVKLVVTDNKGCKDSVVKNVTIFGQPTANFTTNPTKTCFGVPISFADISVAAGGAINTWEWDYDGDAIIDVSAQFPPPKSYPFAGTWTPKLFITDVNGCKNNTQKSIVIVNKPEVDYTYDSKTCVDSNVVFTNTSPSMGAIATWFWDFGDGKNAPFQDVTYKYDFSGTYKVCLYGTDTIGCKDTICKNVTIDEPAVLVHLEPEFDTTICLGATVLAKVYGAQSYKWADNPFLTKVNGDSIVAIKPTNSIMVRYSGKNGSCAEVEDSFKISVVQKVKLKTSAFPKTVVKGSKTELTVEVDGHNDSLLWSPDSKLTCPTCKQTFATPEQTTNFKATIIYSLNGFECSNEDSVTVNVIDSCTRNNVTMPNTFVPNAPVNGKFNHIFYVKGYSLTDVKIFRIFDRWGNQVWEKKDFPANDPQHGWNGKHEDGSTDLEAGVYIYQLSVLCSNGTLINLNSDVTLIK